MRPRSDVSLLRDIGRRISELRGIADLSQDAFSEQLGMTPQYLRRIEAGKANLSVARANAIARSLGVEIEALLTEPGGAALAAVRKPGRPRRR